MTSRDRLMLMGIVLLAVLLGAWFTTVAPERQRAAKLNAEVQAAHQQVASAESQADSALSARGQYSAAYASLVSLGQAVPSTPETPALIFTLDRTTHRRDVQFTSISTGTSGAASSSSSATPTGASAAATFTQMPFTFVFNGSFVDLYKLLDQLEGFTAQTPSGTLHVNGRLLTIDDVNLAPSSSAAQSGSKAKATELTGTIDATAYVLPAGAATLAGASPAGPTTATEAASTSSGSSGAPAPAVVKAP
ncbi:MAG: type II secretion system protein GspM [Solirubrobacteraceae bacterium]